MNKLSMQDATFLYSETENVMNHIASLQQYELPANTTPGEFVESLRDYLADRIHLLPYLTQKVQMMPGGIDHAVWVMDGDFDIRNHVIEVPLGAPGNFEQVQSKVAELHSSPMDRSMPLWRFYIMTGLEDGTIAYYAQIHHACVDGMAGQAMTICLTDRTAEPEFHHCPDNYLESENLSTQDLLAASFRNLWQFQANNFDRTMGMVRTATKLAQRAIDPGKSFGALTQNAPKTPFNHTVGAARTYACTRLPFHQVRGIGKSLKASINDVFLAICSGALRRYLERINQLPKDSLIAGCPVAVAKSGSINQGNSVSLMKVDLFTNTRDPRARLLRIKGSSNTAKQVTAEFADGLETNIALAGLPSLIENSSRMAVLTGAADSLPLPFNVVISNVPGPRETLYSNGAKMLSHYPVSIPAHGLGLNITVQSYGDGLFVGLTACSEAIPDIQLLKNDLIGAYQELKSLLVSASVSDLGEKQDLANLPKDQDTPRKSTYSASDAQVA